MPTYDYQCEKCRKTFEYQQSMKDAALETCPADRCQQKRGWGKGRVKRMLGTGAGLLFKGSGFYITDYRSENYKAAAKRESSGGTESKPAEKKADTKAAAPAKSQETRKPKK